MQVGPDPFPPPEFVLNSRGREVAPAVKAVAPAMSGLFSAQPVSLLFKDTEDLSEIDPLLA